MIHYSTDTSRYRITIDTGPQPEIFQGREVSSNYGTPIIISSKIPEKKALQGKILKSLLILLKLHYD